MEHTLAGENDMLSLLKSAQTIAVVGLSDKPHRDSYRVASYLKENGYRVIPVNPRLRGKEVLGETAYGELKEIPVAVDIVNIFRRSEDVPPVVEEAIPLKPQGIWMQLGIVNEEAARLAQAAGIKVIMDRCIMVEHRRFKEEGLLP